MSNFEQHSPQVAPDDNSWTYTSSGWGDDAPVWDSDPAANDLLFGWSPESKKVYNQEICLAALRGQKLPVTDDLDINTLSHVVKLCILRGTRHHDGFGTELGFHLGSDPDHAVFRRALNARAIMSNTIPEMDAVNDPGSIPYCIWYPDVASEDTYRELARRYPQMRYQVGRACAVAGYSGLYKELNLLPDNSIAEEARDAVMRTEREGKLSDEDEREKIHGSGSAEIFQHIIQQPVRWQVMNDYTRTVEMDNPPPARHGLNGDTAAVSTLQLKRSFQIIRGAFSRFSNNYSLLEVPFSIDDELAPCYFNITEDWSIDECTSAERNDAGAKRPESEAMLELLWNPLPFDLPCGDKDLLILMAAYNGDIGRYSRLRRPQHVSQAEVNCLRRGIYHNTAFARWCSIHLSNDPHYRSEITARFIMSNDLSRITDDYDDDYLPWQIWYPQAASPVTYRELALRKPAKMMPHVARALVIADYQDMWDELVDHIEPFYELIEEARASPNTHYLDSLRESCARRGIDINTSSLATRRLHPDSLGKPFSTVLAKIKSHATYLPRAPRIDDVVWDCISDDMPGIYDGFNVDVSTVELFIAAPKEVRPPLGFEGVDLGQLYYERWNPPSEDDEDGGDSRAYRRRGEWSPRRGGRGGGRGSGIPRGGRR